MIPDDHQSKYVIPISRFFRYPFYSRVHGRGVAFGRHGGKESVAREGLVEYAGGRG